MESTKEGSGCSFVQGKMQKDKEEKEEEVMFPSVIKCQVENKRQASIFQAEPGLCMSKGNSDLSMGRVPSEYK